MINDELNAELFTAIEEENLELIRQALEKGADINAKNNEGYTPLMSIINALPTAGNNDEICHEIIDLLLANKQLDINIYNKDKTALHLATLYLLHNVVEKILNHENLSPTAVEQVLNKIKDLNGASSIKALIEEKEKYTALMSASRNGETAIVKRLIETGDNVNAQSKRSWTALMSAAHNGHTEIVDRLIEAKADVNMQDIDGNTVLHLAARNGHIEIVKLLISNEANIHATNKYGNTPLILAADNGNTEIVELLIKNKANMNAQDQDKNTPLHLAIINGHTETAKSLIKEGVNIEVKYEDGNTPLHLATDKGYIEVAKSIIEKGADIHTKNANGKTFLDLVKDSQVCIPLLELVAKYRPQDAKDFLSNEPDLISKLSRENKLSGELKNIVNEVENKIASKRCNDNDIDKLLDDLKIEPVNKQRRID